MADVTYQVVWETEPADKAGVKKEDLPKGMQSAGKQREWIKSTEEGRAVLNSLKSMNYDIVDVQDEPVYRVKEKGKTKYWVPYGQWYQATGSIGTHTHYALARVEKVQPSAEDLTRLDDVSKLRPEYPGWMLQRQGGERLSGVS